MRFDFALFLSFFYLSTFAQKQDTVDLAEVVILQERMPIKISESGRSVIIITAAQIKQMNVVSLNEVLSYANGVDLRQRGPLGVQGDVGIRGGSFDQTLILINGMKVSDPQTGHHALNLPIPVENIDRIEIIKGPAARLYGSNAYAGAINIITKTSDEKALFAGFTLGQNKLYGFNTTVNLPSKKLKQSISLAAMGNDSFVYNTDFASKNLLYQNEIKISGWEWGLLAAANSKKFGANSFYSSKNYKDQYEETKTYFSGVQFSKAIKKGFLLRGKIYGRRHEDHYILFRNEPSIYENFHKSQVWAAEIGGQTKLWLGSLNFGLDSRNEGLESTNLGKHNRFVSSAFVDIKYPFGKLLVNPGANISLISGYEPQFFPGIDISYDLGKNVRGYFSFGTAYRVPTYTDLYYFGPQNIGNEMLRPETAWNVEIGVKHQMGFVQWSSAVFYKQASNAIEWVRENELTKWQPRNFTNVQTVGFEADVNILANQINGFKQKILNQISMNYTYLNTNFNVEQNLESKYQIEMLKHQFIAKINHNLLFGLKHNMAFRILDRYNFSGAYTLLDSRIYWQTHKYQIFAEATNLLNAQYYETNLVQMPGRWFRVGASIKFMR